MPYAGTSELPPDIRSVLPIPAQQIFVRAFNSAYNGSCNGNDECSMKIAWEAVKAGYQKVESGMWQPITNKSHRAILNSLDRMVDGKWFTADAFEQSVNLWENTPLIYANSHPNLSAFTEDPQKELTRINGSLVGYIGHPAVNKAGHPKLMGDMVFDPNFQFKNAVSDSTKIPEVLDLVQSGKLSHSTGFYSSWDKDNRLTGSVSPHHVLLFEEDYSKGDMPKDPGAFILNKEDSEIYNKGRRVSTTTENKLKSLFSEFMAKLSNELKNINGDEMIEPQTNKSEEIDEMELKELADKLAITNKELGEKSTEIITLKAENDQLKEEIKNKDAELAAMKAQENKRLESEKDAKWAEAKKLLKPGLTHKEEDNLKYRDMFENDKDQFYATVMSQTNKDETDPEGDEFVNKNGSEDGSPTDAELSAAREQYHGF
jgi:cation transport regulator